MLLLLCLAQPHKVQPWCFQFSCYIYSWCQMDSGFAGGNSCKSLLGPFRGDLVGLALSL